MQRWSSRAYTIIGIWQNNHSCGSASEANGLCYQVASALDLATVAAALTGACFGFLWWNASPAKIILGDTGSLALGAAMAGLALLTRTELLLIVLGGLYVAVTGSVMLQVSWFKLTRRTTGVGKRIFRMAPLQHHFELLGWEQVTVVIRFWIIAGICAAAALGIFYSDWVASHAESLARRASRTARNGIRWRRGLHSMMWSTVLTRRTHEDVHGVRRAAGS